MFGGDKLIVFLLGGASYSEVRSLVMPFLCVVTLVFSQKIRSVYEVRDAEKRDIVFGSTCFLKPKTFLESLAALHQPLVSVTRYVFR